MRKRTSTNEVVASTSGEVSRQVRRRFGGQWSEIRRKPVIPTEAKQRSGGACFRPRSATLTAALETGLQKSEALYPLSERQSDFRYFIAKRGSRRKATGLPTRTRAKSRCPGFSR